MTANFHTDIVTGAPNTAATFNAPVGQLDAALTNLIAGSTPFTNLAAAAAGNLGIVGGVVTRSKFVHLIDTEGLTATDDLDTILGGSFGLMLIIKCNNSARFVVVKHGTGNIKLAEEKDYVLDDTSKSLWLFHDGTQWTDISPARRIRTLGVAGALTIASDAITITRSRHTIDTEGAAATDDLKTINGGTEGATLELAPTSIARVITVRHNRSGGNIRLASGADVRLDDPKRPLHLTYDGTNWVQPLPTRFAVRDDLRRTLLVHGNNIVFNEVGLPAGTTSGTLANANQTDSAYTQSTSGAVAGNTGGWRSTTFNLVRRQWNPVFWAKLILGAGGNANARYWIGLFASTPTNVDVPAVQMIAFRYSSVLPDTNWMGVVYDGVTPQTVDTTVAAVVGTVYLLRLRVDDANGVAYFSVNNSAEVSLSANLPAAGTELGFAALVITNTAAGKIIQVSRLGVETD